MPAVIAALLLSLLPGNQPLQRIGSVTHTNQSGTQESRNDYMYDAAGQLESETISQLSSPISTRNYAYDPTGQLTSVKDENNTTIESFDFDDSGNREEWVNLNTNSIYSVGENNRYQNVTIDGTTWTFTYDEEGNLVSKASVAAGEVWFYEYDHRNRMVKAEKRPDMSSPVELSVTFTYDLFDRRIAKTTISDLPSANSRSVYRYNGDMIWKESVTTESTESYYLSGDRIDQWLAKQTVDSGSSELNWFQADRLGSITGIADETGETQVSYSYSAFGERTTISQLPPTISNNLGFTGRELDQETGLYYYRARYYDPQLGRFISEDPIGFGASDYNLTRYVFNNPNQWNDPYGLFVEAKALEQIRQGGAVALFKLTLEFSLLGSEAIFKFITFTKLISSKGGDPALAGDACGLLLADAFGLISLANSALYIEALTFVNFGTGTGRAWTFLYSAVYIDTERRLFQEYDSALEDCYR